MPKPEHRRQCHLRIADGRTTVPLHLEPWGTVFVVFRETYIRSFAHHSSSDRHKVATLNGPWNLTFQSGRGAPDSITLNELSDWSNSDDLGVKYFSGIGTYTKTVQASPDWFGKLGCGSTGDVKNLAEVTVNGKELGQAWHAPYRVEVSALSNPG